jgi:pimeloyl-ACP methyl ester carboxylesterase
MTTYVLVHGGFHGGWCWVRVAERLRAAGHQVFTPTLTGLGERSHLLTPDVSLSTHIEDLVNVLTFEQLSDVVLVGHSYGGMVITGVADRLAGRIGALVYADAFVPRDGQSLIDFYPAGALEVLKADASGGWLLTPPEAVIYDLKAQDDRDWIDGLLTPQPLRTLTDPISLVSDPDAFAGRRTFVCALDYQRPQFRQLKARFEDDPTWATHGVHSGHNLMVDVPDALAAILLDIQPAPAP